MSESIKQSKNLLKEYIEPVFSVICGIFLFISFLIEKIKGVSIVTLTLYIISYFFGAYFIFIESVEKLRKKKFEIDFLMIVAAIGAAILGDWTEGALLLFLFSLGHSLEHYALHKAKNTITKLGNLLPKTAILKVSDSKRKKVSVSDLKLNDIIIVNPDSKIPIDGVVVFGTSAVNQSTITGESIPVEKEAYVGSKEILFSDLDAKNKVFGGTINEDGVLEVKVLKAYKDTVLQKMIYLVQEANAKKSKTQILSKKIEKIFVPIVLVLVFLLCFAFLVTHETPSESFYRAMSVLIASSPCALAISTPSAVLSGIARAAKNSVLIKGGRALEILASINTIAFDKTGTITYGKPVVSDVFSFHNYSEEEILQLVFNLEEVSKHPLSKAIHKEIQHRKITNKSFGFKNIEQVKGVGLKAFWNEKEIIFGKQSILKKQHEDFTKKLKQLNKEGKTVSVLVYDAKCIGIIAFKDLPRKTAKKTIQRLEKHKIHSIYILTGDAQLVGEEVAKEIGVKNIKGDLFPEGKVLEINALIKEGKKVAMVGDGVNDAPAMAASHIGIAMGTAGSEVALETAEVALLSDKIQKLPFVISLSQKAKQIILQNLIVSISVVLILIPLAMFGITGIGETVLIHEGSTVIVVFNALRLLAFKDKT
ncbi:heavy metal translocating P-type ATPase [Aureivirga marina]|uniref:heavy metal translocating P-type ATPase n=1 Tax=Aureivirga marina TaxID=1182451 RepID=UPI0018CAFEB8|nr:heavy metal translocating P-type ATPase [Aureivirga marina]